jgi:glycerophosphoryl diester phosphodiesterase
MERSGSPLWISHRGFAVDACENTQSAFDRAVELGFRALETDLRLTADGHIVLSHDLDFVRLGANISSRISQMARRKVAEIKLRDGSSPLFFDEFVRRYAGCTWTLDIKPESGSEVIAELLRWSREAGSREWLESNVRFLVWRRMHYRELVRAFPRGGFYAMESQCWRAGIAAILHVPFGVGIVSGTTYSIPPRALGIDLFTQETVDYYHQRGAKVLAFLPKNDDMARLAIAAGFDEILTDGKILELIP